MGTPPWTKRSEKAQWPRLPIPGIVAPRVSKGVFPTDVSPSPTLLAALQDIAAWARHQWDGQIIGVTGSAGKTTTKDIIASMLAVSRISLRFISPSEAGAPNSEDHGQSQQPSRPPPLRPAPLPRRAWPSLKWP